MPTMKLSRRLLVQSLATVLAAGKHSASSVVADELVEEHNPGTQESPAGMTDPSGDSPPSPQPGMPTLGGRQFWGDVHYRQGFRIQQNVFTRHFRLLDSSDRRYASGTLEVCEETLKHVITARNLPNETGHVVVCLHGIGRSSKSLTPVIRELQKRKFTTVPFDYPGIRATLADCAGYLAQVLDSLKAAEKISFVVHSMGGLVVRRMLQDRPDPRYHRLVMLGTPNLGAELAGMLRNLFLFRAIYGPAGQELVPGEGSVIAGLPIPEFQFGIIAGGKGDDHGFNRFIPGDDDGTVTVASTRLPGAADFLRIPRLHSFLMADPTALQAIQCFLESGRFFPDRDPQPVV
jgi:pimeloyl-ACP methyl ester carboxylesterase